MCYAEIEHEKKKPLVFTSLHFKSKMSHWNKLQIKMDAWYKETVKFYNFLKLLLCTDTASIFSIRIKKWNIQICFVRMKSDVHN